MSKKKKVRRINAKKSAQVIDKFDFEETSGLALKAAKF